MTRPVPTTVVYVASADSREIHVLRLDRRNGDLTSIETVATGGAVMPLAVSPDHRYLYAALRSEPYAVASYAIHPLSGKLSHLGTSPLPASMPYISTDRSGRFLLCASYGGNQLAVLPIDDRGQAQPAQQILPTEPHAHSILTDSSNRHVYAACLGGDLLMQLDFDQASGRLTPLNPPGVRTRAKAGPRHFRFHPNGRLLYLLCELDAALYVYAHDPASGGLEQLQEASTLPPGFSGKPWAADIRITPDGRYLYTSERTSSTLCAMRIDAASGKVLHIGHTLTEKEPRGFNLDPGGRYLLAVGQASHGLASYAINQATGALALIARIPMGQNPNWVEIIHLPQE
jgi:6-phosphogluconolactonase